MGKALGKCLPKVRYDKRLSLNPVNRGLLLKTHASNTLCFIVCFYSPSYLYFLCISIAITLFQTLINSYPNIFKSPIFILKHTLTRYYFTSTTTCLVGIIKSVRLQISECGFAFPHYH